MAYREVTMVEVKEVLRQWLLAVPKKRIASGLGLDPKTVRHYCELGEKHGVRRAQGLGSLTDERVLAVLAEVTSTSGRPRGDAWERCVALRERIAALIGADVKLTKVRKLLARDGDVVPYATLHRFAVSELGFGQRRATVAVADGEPGQELQIDIGWMVPTTDERGRRRKFKAWIFTPVLSRYRFVYPIWNDTTECAIAACEAAWSFYRGVFHVLIPDNTSSIVHKPDPLEPVFNEVFLEYAQARGFVIDAARVRRATDKARVERTVRYVRDDCYGGEVVRDLGHAYEIALWWCREDAGMKPHSTTLRIPREHFESTERVALLPAPTAAYDVPYWCEPKVSFDHYAQVKRALYSLPTKYIGRRLRARADSQTVRLYDRGVLVKTHPRKAPGGRSTDDNDFPNDSGKLAGRTTDWLVERAKKHGEQVAAFAEALLAAPQPWARMRRVYALLDLCDQYGNQRVDEACALALEMQMHDLKRLGRMLERGVRAEPPRTATQAPPARFARPATTYALRFAAGDTTEGESS
ncbi:MAG: transposase [Rhodocyclaceae bacterium]|nr:MAG: transposase [Rhodocyclaceae bacterium]TNC95562.1 MAG: transposase [Rhodocyclaceae bacterium]